jgi:hypothetical protein
MRNALLVVVFAAYASRFAVCGQPAELRLSEWRSVVEVPAGQYRAAIQKDIAEYRRDCVENGRHSVVCIVREYSYDILLLPRAPEFQYDATAFLTGPLTLAATTRPEDFGFTRQ